MRFFQIFILLGLIVFVIACERKAKVSGVRKEIRIMDDANLLTTQQEDSLFDIVQDVEAELGSQIAVYTAPTLNGESIDSMSLRIAKELKLGRAGYDDGVLVTVAPRERRMRVEVGLGLEKVITNEIAAGIDTTIMAPKFRVDNFSGGLKDALLEIKRLLEEHKELIGQH
jgi:uncharacterized protein